MLTKLLFHYVVTKGDLQLVDHKGRKHKFGDGTGHPAVIKVHDSWTDVRIFFNPKLAIGEAFTDGRLTVEEGRLYDFLTICVENTENLERHPIWSKLDALAKGWRYLRALNPVRRAQRNVAHHYDLSGELYDLFLDEDRQYSCAYFKRPGESLEDAQRNKKEHIASKLLLDRPDLKVLDIGSGWGGLGLFLAKLAGAEVTGLTLSTEQYKISNDRARSEGLEKRVRFNLEDYRLCEGSFDRIVSVGMFEHVGPAYYRTFFQKVRDLMDDDAVMLLHSIGHSDVPSPTNPWITKYIFPGGYLPALSEVLAAVEKARLYVTDIEILRFHYADTLREWRRRFMHNRERAKELYDERFCRMWEFYLTSCETAFRSAGLMVFQIQLTKKNGTVPTTRDYIYKGGQGLRIKSLSREEERKTA